MPCLGSPGTHFCRLGGRVGGREKEKRHVDVILISEMCSQLSRDDRMLYLEGI